MIETRLVQYAKAKELMEVRLDGSVNVTEASALLYRNAWEPMVTMLDGIVIDVRPEPEKASLLMVLRLVMYPKQSFFFTVKINREYFW